MRVDAMTGQFPNAQPLMQGIRDNGNAATKAVPTVVLPTR
jgi:hypothetical protein